MAASLTENDAEPVTFLQSCPVCGRRLHIAVEYNGTEVVCFHCHAMFRARKTGNAGSSMTGRCSPRNAVQTTTNVPVVTAALG